MIIAVVAIWLALGLVGACFSIKAFEKTGGANGLDYMFFFSVGLLAGPMHTAMGIAYWLDVR